MVLVGAVQVEVERALRARGPVAAAQVAVQVPGREVGEAYRFLLELRLEQGPQESAKAEQALRDWWTSRR